MEENNKPDYTLAVASSVSGGKTPLPESLQKFYDAYKDKGPGEYAIWGGGVGFDNFSWGPVTLTVDNVRVSCIYTEDYESATVKNMKFAVVQGYAQAFLFDRFYASCLMLGKASTVDAGSLSSAILALSTPKEEREKQEEEKISQSKLNPTFFTQIENDPINEAKNTNGIYFIEDPSGVDVDIVCQAIGIADFADNPAFGLVIAVSANINTFTNAMTFTVAASIRLASSKKFTVAGEVGLREGKLNAIGLYLQTKIPIMAEVYLTQANFNVKGFQEPKVAVGFGGTLALGPEVEVPSGLGVLQKALFPNKTKFYPLELSVSGEINPVHDYYSFSGKGAIFGSISVSGSFAYDAGDIKAEVKAGLVRNSFLNGSLSATFNKKKDNWNLRANFNCSVTVDFLSFAGISVGGSVDVLLSSQNYTVNGMDRNKKDLTITVAGMAKVKVLFSFSLSVQKTWVFHLSDTQLASEELLLASLTDGDTSFIDNTSDVLVCESRDIVENQLPQLRVSSDVIETKSWQIDTQCSESGVVRLQVAAEYTLVDSNWRLTHSDGNTITVYTEENAGDAVTVQKFAHNYYELLLDTPDAGDWTLEILGDSNNSGGIYMDALYDEKFVTQLEIIEQSDTAIKFRYSAFTGAADDTTVVRLFAEEISTEPGATPYSGIIAYLEETENGEFVWEIPEEFRHNANYRFYISAASSNAGTVTESNDVEVFLARLNAELDCSWELAYNAGDTDTITAYITVRNTGADSTAFKWEILDYTNKNSVDAGDVYLDNSSDIAEVLASGSCLELKGNSSVTIEQVITITGELRDAPSSLLLSVTRETDSNEDNEIYADDSDEIIFSAAASENCREQTISWQAVDGADHYVLHYALEGDWEAGGIYVNYINSTSYVLSVAPGEYTYRVIAMDREGKAIGTWSEEQEVDVLFHDEYVIHIAGNVTSSRSQIFSLNDGVYDLKGIDLQGLTGTLTLFRNDLIKVGEEDGSIILEQRENDILTLRVVNGVLQNPMPEHLLDNGDYFWEWKKTGNSNSAYDITLELSGEVFSAEQADRGIVAIGSDPDMPCVDGVFVEKLEGEVGFCNKDAIYQYMTDDGGELSLTVRSGTVFDSKLKLSIYVQNSDSGEFECEKSLTVNAGEYSSDTVICDNLVITNNFYVRIESWDDGQGEYNTDYSFDLSFDAFEDSAQSTDILEINGEALQDWIGYQNEAHTYLMQVDKADRYAVRLQGDASDATLKVCRINGVVIEEKQIGADGTAYIDDIYLESGNYFVVVNSTDNGEGYFNTDYVLSASELKTLYPKIDNSDDTLTDVSQAESQAFNVNIENWLGSGDYVDYFKFSLDPEIVQNYALLLKVDAMTAQAIEDGFLEISCYDEWGQVLTIDKLNAGAWHIETDLINSSMYIAVSCSNSVKDADYSFKVSMEIALENLVGSADGLSWNAINGVPGYIVEYSKDNFEHIITLETAGNKIDYLALPDGTYQWRVRIAGADMVSKGQDIAVKNSFDEPQEFVSNADGNIDVFFANAAGKWAVGYAAQHAGIPDGWSGTNEQVTLTGKNKLADIFTGSTDANILILTDDANGDALFVDDIYTALPGSVAEQQARIAQIDEIRAGAGDDIVDMTSQHLEYVGDGVKIYGGLGNDTIWSHNGNNALFGDAGNDRIVGGAGNDVIIGGSGNDSMHGGGGDDIFCFGVNWGKDTVEQLDGGTITLWFESGSEENWNADTLTYTDGTNKIKVSGVSAANITLEFGNNSSLRYDELAAAGCFDDAASEKIFADKNKGMLA